VEQLARKAVNPMPINQEYLSKYFLIALLPSSLTLMQNYFLHLFSMTPWRAKPRIAAISRSDAVLWEGWGRANQTHLHTGQFNLGVGGMIKTLF
jgi:hypothetical protein